MNTIVSIEPGVSAEGCLSSTPTHKIFAVLREDRTLAYDDEEMRGVAFNHPDWGSEWRQRDFQFVTSEAFRKLLQENNVKLVTWREISQRLQRRAR